MSTIISRRDFIKGLIRCAPALVVPKLIFDLAPIPYPALTKANFHSTLEGLFFRGQMPDVERGWDKWRSFEPDPFKRLQYFYVTGTIGKGV